MTTPDKPDFSNVKGSISSTEAPRADFSNVHSTVTSTEDKLGGDGSGRTYTVLKGDTISHIAKHLYGKASHWHAIYDANRDQLDDPDRIFPGQVLKIPPHND